MKAWNLDKTDIVLVGNFNYITLIGFINDHEYFKFELCQPADKFPCGCIVEYKMLRPSTVEENNGPIQKRIEFHQRAIENLKNMLHI